MSDSPERMAERIAAIFDTAWEAQGSELTQTEKLLIGWRTAIAQLAADKRDLQWVEHLGYEICFGMTPIDAPEDFDLLIQHSPRVKEARLRDWSPTMKAVPVLVAEALPSEINFKECPWCIESEPEWSNEAKVWIHGRDSLDKACLNPKFHEWWKSTGEKIEMGPTNAHIFYAGFKANRPAVESLVTRLLADKERIELEARIEEAKWWHGRIMSHEAGDCSSRCEREYPECGHFADLESQLAALDAPKGEVKDA